MYLCPTAIPSFCVAFRKQSIMVCENSKQNMRPSFNFKFYAMFFEPFNRVAEQNWWKGPRNSFRHEGKISLIHSAQNKRAYVASSAAGNSNFCKTSARLKLRLSVLDFLYDINRCKMLRHRLLLLYQNLIHILFGNQWWFRLRWMFLFLNVF
jgi:hypothetical protein